VSEPIPAGAVTAAAARLETSPLLRELDLTGWANTVATIAVEAAWPHLASPGAGAVSLNRERAFGDWHGEVILGTDIEAVSHEAFCAGWEAAEPARSAAVRIAGLEALAAEILGSYHRGSDGYRGRVGQVQHDRWRARLDGDRG
jgi:hypothetical protein